MNSALRQIQIQSNVRVGFKWWFKQVCESTHNQGNAMFESDSSSLRLFAALAEQLLLTAMLLSGQHIGRTSDTARETWKVCLNERRQKLK